ncbi:MAG: hypothetical protein VX737_06640 [Pseudomonadota bacterium]|nr:hypothetical protein [Pseudomonadota bacterium]
MSSIKDWLVKFGESSFNATEVFFQTFLCWQIGVVMACVMQCAASGGAMPGDLLLFALVASEVFVVGNSLFEAGKSFWAKFSRDEDYSGPFGQKQYSPRSVSNDFTYQPPMLPKGKHKEDHITCEEKATMRHEHHRGCSCCGHR